MNLKNPISSSESTDNELLKSQLNWLDDDLMKSEVKKLSLELRSRSVVYDNEELDLCINTKPTVKSDYHNEIKDGEKEIEIDGKKYLQKYQRHIQLEKHSVKQIYTFLGDETSILDFDVQINATCCNLPKTKNEILLNLNISDDMKEVMSPKIVIRSVGKSSAGKVNLDSPPIHEEKHCYKNEIYSFIDKYGQTDLSELGLNKQTSVNLRNSFISQWQKTETESQPQSHCKTISCVQRFRDISKQGKLLHRSTCVQMTRSLIVRSKSADGEVKSNVENIVNLSGPTERQLLFKINVSDNLMYNDKFNSSTEITGKQLSIAAGHVDALIAHACSIGINISTDYHLFYNAFVITYPIFITTEELLEKLIRRFKYFCENIPDEKELFDYGINSSAEHIRGELLSAVINLMVQVINYWSRPLTKSVADIFLSFGEFLNKCDHTKYKLIIQSSLKLLESRVISKDKRNSEIRSQIMSPGHYMYRESSKTILDFSSRTIAEHLTILESEIFDQLEIEDILNFKAASNHPSLMKCVQFFNKLTFWVKTQLIMTDNEKLSNDWEKKFNRFIDILKDLKFHKNFSGYTSILYSLNDFPDTLLSKKSKMKFAEESHFMNLSNKKLYLSAVQSAEHPFIPLLAETFSHLTRLNEIMPTYLDTTLPDKPSVNFKKMWQYFIIIQYFVVKMHLPPEKKYYHFKTHPDVLAFINEFKDALTETEFFLYKEKLIRSKSKKNYQRQVSLNRDLPVKDL